MQRQTCHFNGRVQGVGFRYTVENLARQFAVRGYVKNLPDRRVELVMEGDQAEMDGLLQAIEEKMEGFIRDQTCEMSPATGQFHNFEIRH